MDSSLATKIMKVAVAWGVLGIGLNLLCLHLLLFRDGAVPLNAGVRIPYHPMYQLANTVLVAALVYGIYRRCLPCPIILIANAIGRAVYSFVATGHLVILTPAISVVIYGLAIAAMLALKKTGAAERTD
ncbi:MAG: hypothetical protein JSU70_10685 [Phycisphaerales bacterium]|nr:MAG: hypothetical protein JSU70_10685 [Phycisphaerales bacterium]